MKTFFENTVPQELRQRLQKLDAQTRNQWGKMNAAQMLAHCTAAMQVPVGDLQVKGGVLSLIGWMFKGMLVSEKPFSKDSPTAGEFLIQDEREFDAEKQRFMESFHKLAQGSSAITCHKHPFFGKMTTEDWGHLMYKHLDHHFRQFGL